MAISDRKSRRAFRPACTGLEQRAALSLTFSGLMHSLFPFLVKDDKPAPRRPAGSYTAHVATLPGHPHARGHAARPAAATGANPADPTPTPPTVLLAGRLARNAAAARQAAHNAMVARNSHAGQ